MYTLMNSETEIEINGKKITIKEYKGWRVVTLADIDLLHNRPEGTARRNFNKHKKHLIEGVDFFVVKSADIQKNEIRTSEKVCSDEIRPNKLSGISSKANRGIILLTASGYLMLVKSFRDELSWQVQRQLINGYFFAVQMQKEEIQKKEAEEEEDKYSVFNIPMLVRAIMGICEAVYLLKEENKKLKEKSQAYYKDIYFLKKEVKKLKEENREFNQICKQNQAKINFLKEDIKELKNENEKLNEKIKS